ncbi:protein boule-like isoform X2 [Podarcis lilfordi]|uniref:Protein boule-like isoform X2 n=1 Tax=Podarcis lilfordi TaxID=74358 RepID=A0AA35JL45_9SAUR|nr:protein boule-like isoform X2 [Podarcis lilfordi]
MVHSGPGRKVPALLQKELPTALHALLEFSALTSLFFKSPHSPSPIGLHRYSDGYGFITFETQEDAQKILQEAEKLNYKDKKLNIGPAIRKQQVGIPRSSIMPAAGTMYLTTSTGYPYTYHNGVAYFHTPEVASVPQPWPSRSISSSPVMVAQPVYQQPTYHYQAPAQCLPGQWQWSIPQSPASPTSFFYLHPSEITYQPLEIAQDGGCVAPPLSLMEAAVPEPYSDHGVQAYHQVYAQGAIAMSAPVMQPESVKGLEMLMQYF